MRRLIFSALLVVPLLAAGGCAQVKETFGLNKRSPDEFSVYQREPLVMPTEFTLPAPVPGSDRPSLVGPRDKAVGALLGPRTGSMAVAKSPNDSDGLAAFKREAGAQGMNSGIRATVNAEDEQLAKDDKTIVEKLKFWGKDDTVYGVAVDPEQETKRLQANRALGKPINEGDVPNIPQKRKGILEGLF